MNLPNHIAFIMDGNRRWAVARGLPAFLGHRQGAKVFERIVELCVNRGIKSITFYAFSTENWKRSEEEVSGLFRLMKDYAARLLARAEKNDLQVKLLGDIAGLEPDLRELLSDVVEKTKNNQKATVSLAINYGGRAEIIRAIARFRSTKYQITEENFEKFLDTAGQSDPDLIVRTGGEKRLSNFLSWQSAYSELFFTDCLWPDFKKKELDAALKEYNSRLRRFGK